MKDFIVERMMPPTGDETQVSLHFARSGRFHMINIHTAVADAYIQVSSDLTPQEVAKFAASIEGLAKP